MTWAALVLLLCVAMKDNNENKFVYHFAGFPIYCEVFKLKYYMRLKASFVCNAPNVASVFIDYTSDDDAQGALLQYLWRNGVKWLQMARFDWEKLRDSMREQNAKIEQEKARFVSEGIKLGYTHLTTAVVHPKVGDDYVVRMLTNGHPLKKELNNLLKASVIKTDYKVEVLEPAKEAVA